MPQRPLVVYIECLCQTELNRTEQRHHVGPWNYRLYCTSVDCSECFMRSSDRWLWRNRNRSMMSVWVNHQPLIIEHYWLLHGWPLGRPSRWQDAAVWEKWIVIKSQGQCQHACMFNLKDTCGYAMPHSIGEARNQRVGIYCCLTGHWAQWR